MRLNRQTFLLIFLLAVLVLVVLLGPGVYTLYQRQNHQPQIETIYQSADREPPEKIV